MKLGNYLDMIPGNTKIILRDRWDTLYRGEACRVKEGSFSQCEIKAIKNTTIIIDYD